MVLIVCLIISSYLLVMLRFYATQVFGVVNATSNAELQTNTINKKDAGNVDLVFERN